MNRLYVADKPDVVILDDQAEYLRILVDALSDEFVVHPFSTSGPMLRYLDSGRPADIILLDIVMPFPDGFAVCRSLRDRSALQDVPIVFLTALNSESDEETGLNLGAVDYITKPFSMPIVKARVRHHTRLSRAIRIIQDMNEFLDERVAERTAQLVAKNVELGRTQEATVQALATLMETRDNETGHHIHRTQSYVRELAREASKLPEFKSQLDDAAINDLYRSAALHDIGKVAIPDNILLKPGKLEPEEFEVMKTHATHGYLAILNAEKSLGTSDSFLRHARDIAHSHHERWNGSGYPEGLKGEEIPLSARLMAIADVYDALINARSYKAGMPHAKAVDIIREGRGSHFDPRLVDVFLNISNRFDEIAREFQDPVTNGM